MRPNGGTSSKVAPVPDCTFIPAISYGPCGNLVIDFATLPKGTRVQNVIIAWAVSKIYIFVSRHKDYRSINSDGESEYSGEDLSDEDDSDLWSVYQAELTFHVSGAWRHTITASPSSSESAEELDPFDAETETRGLVRVSADDARSFYRDETKLVATARSGDPFFFQFARPRKLAAIGVPARDAIRAIDYDCGHDVIAVFPKKDDNPMVAWWLPGKPHLLMWQLILDPEFFDSHSDADYGYRNLHFELAADPEHPGVRRCYSAEIQLMFVNPRTLCQDTDEEESAELVKKDISEIYGDWNWKWSDPV